MLFAAPRGDKAGRREDEVRSMREEDKMRWSERAWREDREMPKIELRS